MKYFLILVCLLSTCCWLQAHEPEGEGPTEKVDVLRALVFSDTADYRHPEIPAINRWLVLQGDKHAIQVDVTEHWKDLQPESLNKYEVLILNNSNALHEVIPEKQRQAVEAWFQQGGGIVALHAALVRQQEWKWLSELAGCDFDSDSEFMKAKVLVDPAAKDHPAVKGQPDEFWYESDWTNHTQSVTGQPGIQVLLRVDESTYEPVRDFFKELGGKPMGEDHPIAWINTSGSGRFFYTQLGHDVRSLDTEFGTRHVMQAIRWAAESEPDSSETSE